MTHSMGTRVMLSALQLDGAIKIDNAFNMAAAYRAAEWDRALGFSGPEDIANIVEHCPHVRVANCKNVIKAHGAYKMADTVYRYIAEELSGSKTPQFITL